MDGKTFRKIVNLTKPFVSTVEEREGLVAFVLFGTPFGTQIKMEGAAQDFAARFVERLSDETIDNAPALVPLLEYLYESVGDAKKAEIDGILTTLREEKPAATPQQQPDKSMSGGMNISIAGDIKGENINFGNQTINGDFSVNKTRRDK
jgi:hypothetical protein